MKLTYPLAATGVPLLALALIGPVALAAPTGAQAPSNPSAADAYGLMVAARLLQGNIPVNVGPLVESSSNYPSGGPSSNSLLSVPSIPSDGSIVKSLGVITTSTNADGTPQSTATAETTNAALLPTAGVPTISADVVKAQSNSNCTAAPNANGTQFVNLKVGPVVVPANPPPNTTIALGLVTVIVNEQHPTADGRGLVVNGLHIIAPGTLGGTPLPTQVLLQGDIIVSHAVSTVVCPGSFDKDGNPVPGAPNGSTATKATTPIVIGQTAKPTSVGPGGSVTYTATITNRGPAQCLVDQFTDHLPVGFSPTGTSGALGTKYSSTTRPDKGNDITIVPPSDVIIAPGKSVTQQITVTAPTKTGTYANNLEVLCSDLGDFVSTGAPVTVADASNGGTNSPSAATPVAAAAPELPRTGGPNPIVPIGGVLILTGGIAAARRRRLSA